MAKLETPHPDAQLEAAKGLVLDIVAARGGRFSGQTLLYKAFYLSHLYYWRDHQGTLTDYPIVRMPHGPGIDQGEAILAALEREGSLEITQDRSGPYPETVFSLRRPFQVNPDDPRHQAVLRALEWIGSKTATEVSHIIHENSIAWQTAVDGQEMNLYLDLLTEQELAQAKLASAEVDAVMREAFRC